MNSLHIRFPFLPCGNAFEIFLLLMPELGIANPGEYLVRDLLFLSVGSAAQKHQKHNINPIQTHK